ncbi:DNA polymerase alpha subunit B N-terminal-domain-containing protein [Dichotomopilus funicola]|uniref:DNA polymerase alpha subunit B n=1 Tax=Dichotomopilus funicola TaxID=1934379 RepID=A0AAN6V138_9PEZI|nr:DNA polymerase alpha subunit B N-terminal-domain-containing protein [Dichotomopilus funicola]
MADTAELNERFGTGSGKPLEPDVVHLLQSLMRTHNLSAQDLFFKWESYGMKMGLDDFQVSIETLTAFSRSLLDELERSNRAQGAAAQGSRADKRVGATPRGVRGGATTGGGGGGDVFGMLDGLTTPGAGRTKAGAAGGSASTRKTPAVTRAKAGQVASSSPLKVEEQLNAMGAVPPSSFAERPNAGEVLGTLNEQLDAAEPPIAPFPEPRVKLTATSDQKKLGYKDLAMKLNEASEILDDRIEDFVELVMQHHGLEDSALGNPASQSTSEIVAIGRIASDSAEGKLNAASLVLETSRRMGNGRRVHLNLNKLKSYHFFPGQIVALKGTNTSGREFTVHEVLDIPLLNIAASSPDLLAAHTARLRGSGPDAMDTDSDTPLPLTVLFASGPYTADDNLDFEPLHTLCRDAADNFTDVLVLTGPFIDLEHPLIATGDFDLPPAALAAGVDPDQANLSTLFKYLISPALNRLVAANPSVSVLLVPSLRDALDKHVAWPQDAFIRRESGLHKAVRIVGNPMTLSINEMVLGVSSQDILFELRQEELVGARPGTTPTVDPFSRVSQYLVEQRHFFPLFPSADRKRLPKTGATEGPGGGLPPGAALDVSYLKLGEMVSFRPDVLVLPSALPPFVNVVSSVVVINPGFLSKRKAAGTFAKMTLYPPSQASLAAGAGGPVPHKIYERARVEITRI